MTLGCEDVSVPRTHGGADVLRLAGFLRDDDLIGHYGSLRRMIRQRRNENILRTKAPRKRCATSSASEFSGSRALRCDFRAPTQPGQEVEHKLTKIGVERYHAR